MTYDDRMNSGKLEEQAIDERVWRWTLGGESIATSFGANCVGIAGRDAVLLVDPLIAPAHARLVEEAVRAKTDAPVRYVVLTHHHTDHALGSSWFARGGATVIAHPRCRKGMETHHPGILAERRRNPGLAALFEDAESLPPALTFPDSLSLDLGGLEVRVVHPGHGHTEGDAVLSIPSLRVAICGDLVSNGYHVNYEDASLPGAAAGLDLLLSFEAQTYVPGHGPCGGKTVLEDQKWYHAAIEEAVREGAATGRDDGDTIATIKKLFPGFLLELVLADTVRRLAPVR
jgi:cyclase